MERLISGVSPIPAHKGKDTYSHAIIECDDSLYEDVDTLILSFYNNPEWHNIKGEIVAVDMGGSYRYTRDGKVYDGNDGYDLRVWTVRDECDCGNLEERDAQYEKDEPQDEPICAWHSEDFDYKTVYYVVTIE